MRYLSVFGRVAIGQIDRGDPHHAALRRDHRLQEAGLLVAIVARQPGSHLVERGLGQDRDAVEALLAVDGDVVAERLEGLPRERVVHAFRFLEANDVGTALGEPRCGAVQPLLHGVDVPGRNAHLEYLSKAA